MVDVPNIPNTDRIVDYTASAAQANFTIPWVVIADNEALAVQDMIVTVNDVALDSSALTFVGNAITGLSGIWNGGTLALIPAMVGGERVIILSQRLPRRIGNFLEGKPLPFSTLDQVLDDLFIQARDTQLSASRAIRMTAAQYLDGGSTTDSIVAVIEADRVAAAASASQAAASATIAGATVSQWAIGAGTANAITAVMPTTVTVLTDGLIIGVRTSTPNTITTPTLKIDGTTAHTITRDGGAALQAGDTGQPLSERLYRYNLANTRWELLNPPGPRNATQQIFSSGSGTYTKPAGVRQLRIRMCGGCGGGGGSGTGDGGNGGNGGDTTFNSIVAKGGGGALTNANVGGLSGTGGAGSANFRSKGQAGQSAPSGGVGIFATGGLGGDNPLGKFGGVGAAINNVAASFGGGGGGGGEYVELIIDAPAATYSYAVGAAGGGGSAGTSGAIAASGDAGVIIVDEIY